VSYSDIGGWYKSNMKLNYNNSVFERLHVYGMEGIEDLVIAGLVTGDPVLLVGLHGTAKTYLCSRLANALGLRFWSYDASKAMFEDIIGFPNPFKLKKGIIDYVSTPVSIWDKEFILIDEISRANPQMQNKWLELIRSRVIMGLKAENLKYIFAAMNPPGYPGARVLDPALAGRFALIIDVPAFHDVNIETRIKILRTMSEDDAVMLNRREQGRSVNLNKTIEFARSKYNEVERQYGDEIEKFILNLSDELREGDFYFDSRRAGMMRRSIVGLIAVKKFVKKQKISLPEILKENARYMLPYRVEREGIDVESLQYLIDRCFERKEFDIKNPVVTDTSITRMLEFIKDSGDLKQKIKTLFKLTNLIDIDNNHLRNRIYNVLANLFQTRILHLDFTDILVEYLRDNVSNGHIETVLMDKWQALSVWVFYALYEDDHSIDVQRELGVIENILRTIIKE